MSRLRLLFFGESATLSHVARPYFIANALASEQRFEVHFAADDYYDFVFKDSSATVHRINCRSPRAFETVLQKKGVLFDEKLLLEYIDSDLALIKQIRPDLVVGDMRLSLAVSAPLSGVPYIALTNGYWSPHALERSFPLPFNPLVRALRSLPGSSNFMYGKINVVFQSLIPKIFREQAAGLDAARKKRGLEPFSDYLTGFTWSNLSLYCDLPSVVPTAKAFGYDYLGPVCWSPSTKLPSWWNSLPDDRPIVFISLGSSGDPRTLREILGLLENRNVTVAVATANRVNVETKNNIFAATYLPGAMMAQRSSLVITNGGSPATYQALGEGCPVLGIPVNMDQFLFMEYVRRRNVGRVLRSDMITKRNLENAINEILGDDILRANVEQTQREFSQFDPVARFEQAVNQVLAGRKANLAH